MVAKDQQDELRQLLKYEKHELYRNPFGSGFVYKIMLYYVLCPLHANLFPAL